MIHWKRVRYAHCLGLYESPNHVLWELINESKRVTLQRWDTNTGSIYKQEKPVWGSDKLPPEDRDPTIPDRSALRTILEEKPTPADPDCVEPHCPGEMLGECAACKVETRRRRGQPATCANCGHEIRWQRVAVPPRWEHVHAMARDNSSRLFWICEFGCMTPEPKEATA